MAVNSEEMAVNSESNTQRKEKEIKEKKKKEKKILLDKSETDLSFTKNGQLNKLKSELMKTQKEKKTDPLFRDYMDIYFKWMEEERGVPPIVNGREGKALNSILKYFRKQSNTDEQTIANWIALLDNYDKWGNFNQKNIKISGIETNLPNIINSIINGKKSITEGKSIAEMRKEIGSINE